MGTKNFILKFDTEFKKTIDYKLIEKDINNQNFFNFVWYLDNKIIKKMIKI